MTRLTILPLLTGLLASASTAGTINMPAVTRQTPTQLTVSWSDPDPVDILLSDNPAARPDEMKLIAKADRDGQENVQVAPDERAYFLLRDSKSGGTVRIAERLLPLQQGSNFRDIGGYPAAGGKHVRWGLIYRSGGQPMLTDADLTQVRALQLAHLVDLRSDEERVLAPTRIDGVPYQAIGYSMASLMTGAAPANGEGV